MQIFTETDNINKKEFFIITEIENFDNVHIENDIEKRTVRVKLFVFHKTYKKYLIIKAGDYYMLPGGHVEENETLEETCVREIEEESGIKIDKKEISKDFYNKKYYYIKNGINTLSNVYFFTISINQDFDMKKLKLTENEKSKEFKLIWVNLEEMKTCFESVLTSESDLIKSFSKEALKAIQILEEKIVSNL